VRAVRLPDGTLLVPVELDDPAEGSRLVEVRPDHPQYGKWLALAEDGKDPRPLERGDPGRGHCGRRVPSWRRPDALATNGRLPTPEAGRELAFADDKLPCR
jgi:hypothetical protein